MGSWKLTRVLAAEHRPLRSEGRRWVMGMSERVVELGDGLPLSSWVMGFPCLDAFRRPSW